MNNNGLFGTSEQIKGCVWIHKKNVPGTWSQFESVEKAIEWATLYTSIHYKKNVEKLTTDEIYNLFNSGEILVEFLRTEAPKFKIYIYVGIYEPLTTSPKRSSVEYIKLSAEKAICFSGDKTPYELPRIRELRREAIQEVPHTPPLRGVGLRKIKSQNLINNL